MSTERRREVLFHAGYDKRGEPGGYGCHGMEIRFLLHGDEGAIQFVISTGWLPSWITASQWGDEVVPQPIAGLADYYPSPTDIGHHWQRPVYEGETLMHDECPYTHARCYYDGSSLNAQRYFAVLLQEGHEALWRKMEEYYAYCAERAAETAAAARVAEIPQEVNA